MAAQYHFLSEFTIRGDPERVWSALVDVRSWPSWWPWLKKVEVLRDATEPEGVGAIYRNTVRAPAGYGFVYDTAITAVEHLRMVNVDSSGDIAGRGRFLVRRQPDGVLYVVFAWLVETPKRWMSFLAPIARPAFNWNHDRMMTAFGAGLAQAAGAELLSSRNSTVSPGRPGFYVMPELPDGRRHAPSPSPTARAAFRHRTARRDTPIALGPDARKAKRIIALPRMNESKER